VVFVVFVVFVFFCMGSSVSCVRVGYPSGRVAMHARSLIAGIARRGDG